MFKDNTIEKRVMAVVKERIFNAQNQFDADVRELQEKLEVDKISLADKHVMAIIGKVL